MVGKGLAKVQFLASCSLPLNEVVIQLRLDPVIMPLVEDCACILKADSIYEDDSLAVLVELEGNSDRGLSPSIHTWRKTNPETLSTSRNTGRVWTSALHTLDGHLFLRIFEPGGTRVSLASFLLGNRIEVLCTSALRKHVCHTTVRLNNYRLFDLSAPTEDRFQYYTRIDWPSATPAQLGNRRWITLTRGPTYPSMGLILNRYGEE